MADKGLNLLVEYAVRCLHLSSKEKQCTSPSWGDCKMYTFETIANSQKNPAGINKNGEKQPPEVFYKKWSS